MPINNPPARQRGSKAVGTGSTAPELGLEDSLIIDIVEDGETPLLPAYQRRRGSAGLLAAPGVRGPNVMARPELQRARFWLNAMVRDGADWLPQPIN